MLSDQVKWIITQSQHEEFTFVNINQLQYVGKAAQLIENIIVITIN